MKKLCNILGCNRCYEPGDPDDPDKWIINSAIALAIATFLAVIAFAFTIFVITRPHLYY